MEETTVIALKGSIEKWQKIVAGTGVDKGPTNCPLCQLFNSFTQALNKTVCVGCPVRDKTDIRFCRLTPFEDWEHYWETVDGTFGLEPKPLVGDYAKQHAEAVAIAQREVDFLTSLLPTAEIDPTLINDEVQRTRSAPDRAGQKAD